MTLATAVTEAATRLATVSESARLDAEVLLAHCLGKGRTHLLAHADAPLAPELKAQFDSLVERRLAGAPVAHLTGRQEFWSLDLEVTQDVLVPRPDTELLVETALELIPAQTHARVLDLGTGSGAIAVALAHERPQWRVFAIERSTDALVVACRNAERLHLDNIEFFAGDWFEPVGAMHFDLIVSNPPYIAADDQALNAMGVRAEPRTALTPGPTGLEAIENIALAAPAHLRAGGQLLVEHGADQAAAVAALFSQAGFSTIRALQDLAGRDRATLGQKQG